MTQEEINDLLERPQPTCASMLDTPGNRKDVLLRAAFDMLRRSIDSPYIIETCEIETHYDGADCDGFCLMEDIAAELGIENDAKPIPLEKRMEAVQECIDKAAKAGEEGAKK